jgi:oligopeptide transport system permease protein
MAELFNLHERQISQEPAAEEQGASLWRDAWLRLRKNRLAIFGLIVISILIVACGIGPTIARAAGYGHELQNLALGPTQPLARH